ncbi:sialin-like isoform X2 [Corticium candelabrum]|nr:sialin-like isoform X2 [Corticium candelabrum]XP_062523357.1 sialin-like isoform X2 [Corticium candelabrum]
MLAEKYGGKWVFGLGCLGTTILTLVTPIAAYHSLGMLLAVRVLEGFGEGVTFPAMHAMWAKWAPPLEKSKLSTISYAGPHFGTIIALTVSGVLCDHGFKSPPHNQRWPSVFYVFGLLGLIWCFAWLYIVSDSPNSHPTISKEERQYIVSRIESAATKTENDKVSALWLAGRFVRSPAVWAIVTSHLCNNWGFYILLTSLPTYFSDVLGFDIKNDGFLSAVPFAAMFTTVILGGYIADFLRMKKVLSTTHTRKLMNSIGQFCPAIFLIATGYANNSVTLAVVFLVLAVGLSGFTLSGFNCTHLDMAPRFAGVLMGLTNTAGTVSGIVAPYVTGAMTTADKFSPDILKAQWQRVFFVSAEIYAFGAIIFLILGSAKQQWWADGPPKSANYADTINTSDLQNEKGSSGIYGSM